MSAVRILDVSTFSLLAGLARMVSLMGVTAIFVGFQPGIASSLIDLQVDCSRLITVICLQDAFDLLQDFAPKPLDNDYAEDGIDTVNPDEIRDYTP
jgi:rsbT antagonist protein RsbS